MKEVININHHQFKYLVLHGVIILQVAKLILCLLLKLMENYWVWGKNAEGQARNKILQHSRSSPVQIPGTTWSTTAEKAWVSDWCGWCNQN